MLKTKQIAVITQLLKAVVMTMMTMMTITVAIQLIKVLVNHNHLIKMHCVFLEQEHLYHAII
jgi:hypothetical protein